MILAALGYTAYSFFIARPQEQKPLERVSIRLGWLHNAQFAGMYVAKDKGFYKEVGLDVDLKAYQLGLNNIDQVVNKDVDFSITAPIEIMAAIKDGKIIKAIASIYQTSPLAFISLKNKNILSPADLKGKILGNKGGTPQVKLKYLALLNKANLTEKDVTFKDLTYATSHIDDLVNNTVDIVDGYRISDPYPFIQKHIDYNLLEPEKFGVPGYGDTIIATEQLIGQKPDVVRNFIQATTKGWQYTIDNPEEALTITKRYEDKAYSDPGLEAYTLRESIPLIQVTGDAKIGSMHFRDWNETAIRMKASGLLNENFEVTAAYTNAFVE